MVPIAYGVIFSVRTGSVTDHSQPPMDARISSVGRMWRIATAKVIHLWKVLWDRIADFFFCTTGDCRGLYIVYRLASEYEVCIVRINTIRTRRLSGTTVRIYPPRNFPCRPPYRRLADTGPATMTLLPAERASKVLVFAKEHWKRDKNQSCDPNLTETITLLDDKLFLSKCWKRIGFTSNLFS